MNLAVVNAQMAWNFAIFVGAILLTKSHVTTISEKDINQVKQAQPRTESNSA